MNLKVGQIVRSKKDHPGAPSGSVGVVFEDYMSGIQVIWETGEYHGYNKGHGSNANEIKLFIQQTSMININNSAYVFRNVIKLMEDYRNGVFLEAFRQGRLIPDPRETLPCPEVKEEFVFGDVVRACEGYIQEVEDQNPEPNKQWIFEASMEMVYGKDVWRYVNELMG